MASSRAGFCVRLADDIERAEIIAENLQRRQIQVVELPLEYIDQEIGLRPLWFYRFTIGSGTNKQHWFWTSFAWPVDDTFEGNPITWEPRRITHDTLELDTSGIRQSLELRAEITDDSPWAVFAQVASVQPIFVEIQTASLPTMTDRAVIFSGVVFEFDVKGKSASLKARAFGLDPSMSLPTHVFSARCPWRVFVAGQCNLDPTGWKKAATISAIAGRTITVQGSALTGLADNWFAEGTFEVTGTANPETRLVMTHPAASGDTITLTLNAPLRFAAVGAAVQLTPGCDGRMATCISKFNNLVNFGGHQHALRNLSIRAVEVQPTAAGKK